MRRRRSLATLLVFAYGLLAVYASLYPFSGWRWPPGAGLVEVLRLPWPHYWLAFDVASNLLAYLPLGGLLFAALVRSGFGLRLALATSLVAPSLLSFLIETLQHFLPTRVPSLADWVLNTAGAALGVMLGLMVHALGGLERWQTLRDRWFVPSSAGALALLLLWPVGLLFPAPVPLGLGQVLPRLREAAIRALDDTPWALGDAVAPLTEAGRALPPGLEAMTIALGLLAPCLLALSVAMPGWRKLGLVFGATTLGVLATAFSTAMSFGPQHALAWMTGPAQWGLAFGGLVAALLCWVPARAVAALGLVSITALIALVSMAPTDPYFAQSLASWEQGRFIRFHGVAQWVGWLWPFLTLAWLLGRVSRRDPA
nr:VanZ family protein [uncultured Roseateles sp.]